MNHRVEQIGGVGVRTGMTFIGHSLTGIAVGAAVLPGGISRRRTVGALAVFALLACVPDFPLPGWGHYKYHISHSIFVNGGLMAVVLLGLGLLGKCKGVRISGCLVVGGLGAWSSHFLLDSMYNHGLGVAIYWPVSPESLALPVPWFSVLECSGPPINARTLSIFALELACYLPLAVGVLLLRRRWIFRRADADGG